MTPDSPEKQEVESVSDCVVTSPDWNKKFEYAANLSKILGETTLRSGRTLREELCVGRLISLWDVVTTAMVLYRFPLFFQSEENGIDWWRQLKYGLRPYQGLAARFRDFVVGDCKRTSKGCTNWSEGSRTILITCFTPSFYQQLLRPVAHSIARRHLARVVVVHGGNLVEERENGGLVTFHSLWDHWNTEVDQAQQAIKQKLRKLQQELFEKSQLKALMENVRSHVGGLKVDGELGWLFWREFVRLAPQVAVAEHIVCRHRPALILSADDADQRCRIYSLLAKAVGVPSMVIQQGLLSKDYPEWRFLSHDKVAAMGNFSRLHLIEQGVDPGRIVVTGHPGFDPLASTEGDEQDRVRQEIGVPIGHQVVLFASQPAYIGSFEQPKRRIAMIKAIIEMAGSMKGVTLVIKPHPGENKKDLISLLRTKHNIVLVDGSINILPLIKCCDVFVTFFSTTAVQALYADKPVITIDLPGSGGGRFYTDSQATWVARSVDDVQRYISYFLSPQRVDHLNSKREAKTRFLYDVAGETDGKATNRVVQSVADLLALGPVRP